MTVNWQQAATRLTALVAGAVFASCGNAAGESDSELIVFAASSLTEAFSELGERFEAENPGTTVTFIFSSSSTLATQILEGAPADVFASADDRQMATVVNAGSAHQPRRFATNRMVIVVPEENPARIRRSEDLARPGVKLVLAAPEVPAGNYARRILDRIGILDTVEDNVVSNEPDVKAVVTKMVLGEADAGVVYETDVTHDAAGRVSVIDFPAEAEVTATYPIAALEGGGSLSSEFVSFILSTQGQTVLGDHGFGAP
jgi:molybdate transport system substrate-binding protein